MKTFLRTVAGKTAAFIVCSLSVFVLMASVFCGAFMIGYDFYTKDKDTVYRELAYDRIRRDVYSDLWMAAEGGEETILLEDKNGLLIQILDEEGNTVARTKEITDDTKWDHTLTYGILDDVNGHVTDIYYTELKADDNASYYTVNVSIDENSKQTSFYSFLKDVIDRVYPLRYAIFGIGLLSLTVLIISFVALMSVAGRRPDDEDLHPGPLNKIPFDLLAVPALGLLVLFIIALGNMSATETIVAVLTVGGILFWNIFLGLCMSMAVRIKQGSLIKGSFTWFCLKWIWKVLVWSWEQILRVFRFLGYLLKNIPLVWKTLILIGAVCIYELIFFFGGYERDFFWVLEKIILIPAILYLAISLRTLQKGGRALASGDMTYRVDTKRLILDLKEHGEDLNDISKGMNIAVEEQMKSERMKTELITNVSHDIKTPLTSIINYTDLISKEKTGNKKINEYTEVLLRQSEKLKRLIDDLVEASKASTGNLEVDPVPCNAAVFVSQADGEYQNRMKEASLTLITAIPDEEIWIMADSRRMWRIFDNLMNNICKYAQPNTRVYLSLEKKDDKALFTFKNVSREQLNISEEELMERFTRGDRSRNTEGNGLGLSIAHSMAQLQEGELHIEIDGDLFKAYLSFPLIRTS